MPKLQFTSSTEDKKAYIQKCLDNWFIPDKYKNINPYNYIRELAKTQKVDLTKKIPFSSNIFGTTLCFGVITKGHLGSEILDELIRVTKKGGFLIFTATQPVYNTLKFRNKMNFLQKKKIISKVEITNTFFAMNKVKNSLVAKAYVYKILR